MRERKCAGRLRAEYREFSPGLLQRNAVAQASEDEDLGSLLRSKRHGISTEWHPVAMVDGKSVPPWHDSDDRVHHVVEPQLSSKYRRFTAESRVPHVVTDDHDRWGAGVLVGCANRTSDDRLHTRDVGTVRRDLCYLGGLDRAAGNGHVALYGSKRADLTDCLHLAPPRHQIVHRPPHLGVRLDVVILERHNPLTALDRQRGGKNGIQEREEARADGDADRKARAADDREPRVFRQHPRAKFEVHPRVVQPAKSARVAMLLLNLLNAAKCSPGCEPGLIP